MNWLEKIKQFKDPFEGSNRKITFSLVFALFSLLMIWTTYSSPKDHHVKLNEASEPLDLAIPEGFALIPIEVSNYESLDSILGSYGVVDLYASSNGTDSKSIKVASAIKILRSPFNPSYFAVLASEAESGRIMSVPGPFMVALQNPRAMGTDIELKPRHPAQQRKLILEDSDESVLPPDSQLIEN